MMGYGRMLHTLGGLGPVLGVLDGEGGGGVGGSGSGVAKLVGDSRGEVVAVAWDRWLACGSGSGIASLGSVVGLGLEDDVVGDSESVVVWLVVGLDGRALAGDWRWAGSWRSARR
jgi:hypothetical protein